YDIAWLGIERQPAQDIRYTDSFDPADGAMSKPKVRSNARVGPLSDVSADCHRRTTNIHQDHANACARQCAEITHDIVVTLGGWQASKVVVFLDFFMAPRFARFIFPIDQPQSQRARGEAFARLIHCPSDVVRHKQRYFLADDALDHRSE